MRKFIEIASYFNWLQLQLVPKHIVSYLDFGDPCNKNIIVCAHGLTRNANDFYKIAKELSSKYRVISIDYPGRGESDYFNDPKLYNYQVYVKDSLIILEKLHIKKPIWLGTSMGGIIGMAIESKHKNTFKALILNDIGPFMPAATLAKIGKYASQSVSLSSLDSAKQHLKMIYNQFGVTSEEDWDLLVKNSFIQAEDGKYRMNYDPAVASAMKTDAAKMKDVNIWHIWQALKCRILLIHGAKSDILSSDTVEKMKQIRNFDLHVVDYAGHAPALMADDQIMAIKTWVSKLEL